ncbi:MAG: hypothetical protein QM780_09405 [Hyphomicrobium sp.]|uniref:hypothetical protein n=1 Tax=Hyphomicrobium sp. TaxID=82 RepID=UPI0039E5FFB8
MFFEWAKTRTVGVANPVADQGIKRRKNKRQGKKVHPWTIDELNRMFGAPIYVGCQSEIHWKQPGQTILRHSAKYWVPLISLFSDMRLGEIIQLQTTDVKEKDGIHYFDRLYYTSLFSHRHCGAPDLQSRYIKSGLPPMAMDNHFRHIYI